MKLVKLSTLVLATALVAGTPAMHTQASAGAGAAVGGFLGLVFGFGLFDVAAGAIVGGAIGAAADSGREGSDDYESVMAWETGNLNYQQQEQERLRQEQAAIQAEQRRVAEEIARLEALAELREEQGIESPEFVESSEPAAAVTEPGVQVVNLEQAGIMLGPDNLNGFKALVACQHEQAIRLSRPGRLSDDANHRLAALWLEVIIAHDTGARPSYERVIEADSEIATDADAEAALGQLQQLIQTDRDNMGISC